GNQPSPDPLHDVLGRLVDIDIDVAQAEAQLAAFEDLGRSIGKDALQNLNIGELELVADQRLNEGPAGVGVLAALVSRVIATGLPDPGDLLPEETPIRYPAQLGFARQECPCPAAPDADLEDAPLQLGTLSHELP